MQNMKVGNIYEHNHGFSYVNIEKHQIKYKSLWVSIMQVYVQCVSICNNVLHSVLLSFSTPSSSPPPSFKQNSINMSDRGVGAGGRNPVYIKSSISLTREGKEIFKWQL